MKKNLIIVIIVILVIAGALAVFLANTNKQNGLDNVTIRLKWLHQSQFAGYYAPAQGIPVVALATTYRKNPLIWFGISENIRAPQDLVGKKVGLTVGSNSDLLFRAMLKKTGIDINDITIVPVKYN